MSKKAPRKNKERHRRRRNRRRLMLKKEKHQVDDKQEISEPVGEVFMAFDPADDDAKTVVRVFTKDSDGRVIIEE